MKDVKRAECGRSMVEMIGYMAVVITLAASLGNIVASAYGNYKFSKASLQITDLANAITKAAAIDANYEYIIKRINSANSEALKIIPPSYKVKAGKIYHAFGGEATLGYTEDRFTLTFHKLNRKQCIEMAMKGWSENKYADLYSITVNGYGWYWPVYTENVGEDRGCVGTVCTLPVMRSAVAGTTEDNGQCGANNNAIIWTFN